MLTIDSNSQVTSSELTSELLGQGDRSGLGRIVVELSSLRSVRDTRNGSNVDDVPGFRVVANSLGRGKERQERE